MVSMLELLMGEVPNDYQHILYVALAVVSVSVIQYFLRLVVGIPARIIFGKEE